jgi:DNA-binding NtrC family response regulator
MNDAPRLLVIDDDRTIREALASTLEEAGYTVLPARGILDARAALLRLPVDAVLLDIRLKDGDGLEFLTELRRQYPRTPVIMATSYGDSDRTISAVKEGAFDFITKPFDLDQLMAAIARAVRVVPVAQLSPPQGEKAPLLVGSSPAMLAIWKAIGRAAQSRAPVLITGESGTGKELVARAIHDHGPARDRPFLAVNLAALPPGLLESELFGHEKGSFTGAQERREGRFELVEDGTLFLDEIGDLEPSLQTKLLRVLEDRGFERVGGTKRLHTRARIVAATSRQVSPGALGTTLREDLYYRLGVIRIHVPPLRQRPHDIPLLVDAFLKSIAGPRRAVSEEAMRLLVAQEWPGNVRQLRHSLESASVMSPAEILDASDLQLAPQKHGSSPDPGGADLDLRTNLERVERSLILRALAVAGGNRAQAARLLGIRRALLYARMKHLRLEDDAG